MRRSTAAALIAVLLVALFARLIPTLKFAYWGSDAGEYRLLTVQLVQAGHLGTDYLGWGKAYPYFPGFYLATGGASLVGLGTDAALDLVSPVLNAVSVLLIFLIAVRIFRDDRIGILAAGILAVAMPYVYTNSHPIPSALGSLFVLASFALLVGPKAGRGKSLAVLIPMSAALVVTHHLSTYFLIIGVLASLVLRSVVAVKVRWRDVFPEIVLLAFTLAFALPYWLVYATPFRENILGSLNAMPWWGPFAALPVGLAAWLGLVRLRQRFSWRFRPRYPDLRRGAATFLAALVFAFAVMILFTGIEVLGTSIEIPGTAVLFLSPFLVLIAFSAPGRRPLDFVRGGDRPTSWLVAFVLSTLLGSVVGAMVLIPYRHIDYLMIPISVMAGAGIVFLSDTALSGGRGRAAVCVLAALLIASNIPVAYPPPDIMAGYDEGTTARSLVAIAWLPGHVSGLLATDHKASTIAFGLGGANATWDTARQTLLAPDFATAKSEMSLVSSPSGPKRVDYVLIDVDVRRGTQLLPYEPAYALSQGAQGKFELPPFERFYDDGYTQIYWVNWGLA